MGSYGCRNCRLIYDTPKEARSCCCKHDHVTLYDEGHRCVKCFAEFTPMAQVDAIKKSIAELILEEFNDYAPEQPPITICEFIEALKEIANDI